MSLASPKLTARGLNVFYGDKHALIDVDIDLHDNEVMALIGPSGCGKSTLLRALNRTIEVIPGGVVSGRIVMDDIDLYDPALDIVEVRQHFGMVAQKPDPFPWSIRYNVLYGAHIRGHIQDRHAGEELLQRSLERVAMWDEVKDRLDEPGTGLSGGQQQRLCIARTVAAEPEVILMDEPCSALDPTATAHVEELIADLREHFAIVIVTHNMEQARRVSQRAAMFHLGRVLECRETEALFSAPAHDLTRDFVTGRFG